MYKRQLKYILISEYLKKGIITKFGTESSSRTAVIKNGIDTTSANLTLTSLEKKELRNNLGLKHSDYVVIFVGRIVKEKGIKEVLEAFEMINENNIKLLILGGTEFANNVQSRFEQEIKDKCRKLQDKVIFTGYIDHEDVWKYYQISDLALLPSMWEEPAGLTIIEAMCNGIPVITTNSGGIPEYMNDKYGVMLNRTPKIAEEIVFSINKFYNKEIKVDTNSERKYVLNNFTEENFYNSFVKLLK